MKKSEGVKKLRKKARNSTKVKGLVIAFLVSFIFSAVVYPCECAASMWSMTYGGTGNDVGIGETVQTSDGGYAVSGDTSSSGAGGVDFWLFKTDEFGNMQWNMTYGGAQDETIGEMCHTSDGGYAIAGGTYSFGAGDMDFWLVKTDSDGNMEWNKTYGGEGYDYGFSVTQASDGGYAIFGTTESFGAGGQDFYLVKTDAAGNMMWNMTYGGNGTDYGTRVIQSGDGYAISGYTNSFGAGGNDYWLVKTDSNGIMQWNYTYGMAATNEGSYYMMQTSDGGYVLGGLTSANSYDAYLVKTDTDGNMEWNKTYGGTGAQIGETAIQTADEGYAIVGYGFYVGKGFDSFLYKTDAAGNMMWNMTYGGNNTEIPYSIIQTSDGGYVLTGSTTSFGAGGEDVWLVKTDESGVIPEGLPIGVMLLLSTVASIVGIRILRKQSKWKRW
jgi:predicted secreted protein